MKSKFFIKPSSWHSHTTIMHLVAGQSHPDLLLRRLFTHCPNYFFSTTLCVVNTEDRFRTRMAVCTSPVVPFIVTCSPPGKCKAEPDPGQLWSDEDHRDGPTWRKHWKPVVHWADVVQCWLPGILAGVLFLTSKGVNVPYWFFTNQCFQLFVKLGLT